MENLQSIIDRFLLELQKKNPATVSHLRRISNFFISDEMVTPTRIMDYVIFRRSGGARPATINRELTIIKQLFKWTKIRGYIEQDPTEHIKFESGVARRTRHITIDEEERLIRESVSWLQPIIQFATSTGMRRGEIINMKKSDINLNDRTATIRASKNGEPRTIPLTNRALNAISGAMSVTDKVFGGKNGGCLNMSSLEYNFRVAAKRTGIENLHFHDLRHACASRWVRAGMDLYKIQILLGHKSPSMTQRYALHDTNSLREAIMTTEKNNEYKRD